MAPWITRKSDSTIGASPFDPFLVITSFWLLVLTALAYDARLLGPASSARFVPLYSTCSDSIRPRFSLGFVGVVREPEDSLGLFADPELEA